MGFALEEKGAFVEYYNIQQNTPYPVIGTADRSGAIYYLIGIGLNENGEVGLLMRQGTGGLFSIITGLTFQDTVKQIGV